MCAKVTHISTWVGCLEEDKFASFIGKLVKALWDGPSCLTPSCWSPFFKGIYTQQIPTWYKVQYGWVLGALHPKGFPTIFPMNHFCSTLWYHGIGQLIRSSNKKTPMVTPSDGASWDGWIRTLETPKMKCAKHRMGRFSLKLTRKPEILIVI